MKLRIRGDSLRLRLDQQEVATLAEKGVVEESIAFGSESSERLTYSISFGGSATLCAKLVGTRVEVTAARDTLRAWAANETTVGIEGAQDAGDGRTLRILVEKDFACLTARPNEDDEHAFPNPKKDC